MLELRNVEKNINNPHIKDITENVESGRLIVPTVLDTEKKS